MSKWNIKDLDKEKTEQSIANEQIRIDSCRVTLEKLIKERDRIKNQYNEEISKRDEQINLIEKSITEGENFILKCNEHLILDFKL